MFHARRSLQKHQRTFLWRLFKNKLFNQQNKKVFMEQARKTFNPNLKVVDANSNMKATVLQFGGMSFLAIVVGLMGYVGCLWAIELFSGHFSWLKFGGLLLMASLCALLLWAAVLTLRDNLRQAYFSRQLRLHATSTKATIVGREKVERPEDNLLYVFYQFRPDFVVRFQDSAKHPRLYSQPIGSEITVYYLPENPEISGILVQ